MRFALPIVAAAAAVLSAAAPASAATTVTFTDGGAPLQPAETIFATFDGGDNGGVSGSGYQILTGSSGAGADPATGGTGDPYLSVLAGGVANFVFSTPLQFLGLDYGSADDYNTFLITLLDGTTEDFTGQEIINLGVANGDQSAPRTNGRLSFSNFSNPIVGLTLTSGANSLEVDRFSSIAAVPEPGTWAMMLMGFGAVGFAMRRRGKRSLLPQMA